MVSREGGREPALEQENPAEQDAESEHEEEDAKDAEEEGIVIESESDEDYAAVLERFAEILALGKEGSGQRQLEERLEPMVSVLDSADIAGVAKAISDGKIRNIVCMCGAGISVNAGIPDFRSPGTGLYSRLEAYDLPSPQAVFEIDFFRKNPQPFYTLANELYPGKYAPTHTHFFIKLLHDKKLLRRCYTQNIDSLEREAGLPREMIIAAHGNFDVAHCIECRSDHDVEYVKEAIFDQTPCHCTQTPGCRGLVKPGIVFFGESLPDRFWKSIPEDFGNADLLIVMGSSLVVQPFASLIDKVSPTTPRLLINKDKVGEIHPDLKRLGYSKGFDFKCPKNRDVFHQGDCDEGILELCKLLEWEEELLALMKSKV